MESTVEISYSVSLEDFPGLPEVQRQVAEKRYGKALEKALGDASGIARAFQAWRTAADSDEVSIDRDTANLATAWIKAADLARQAGMRDLGDDTGAYFEVRLED
jgi:hypothetical protein